MKEPCRSCPERSKDFGGCRCQAYLLTGDPDNQYLMLDTTLVRVHQQAAAGKGGPKIRLWGVPEED